jgi:hypothetical protein
MTLDEIKGKVAEHIASLTAEIGITRLLASFVNEYGLLCEFKTIHTILEELAKEGSIEIVRIPPITDETKKPSTFWEEKRDKKVIIRRRVS